MEDDLIADGDLVVARLTLTATHLGTFAGQAATGRVVSWSSIRNCRLVAAAGPAGAVVHVFVMRGGRVLETWAMQDRLALLQEVGAIAEPVAVNWAGGASPGPERSA